MPSKSTGYGTVVCVAAALVAAFVIWPVGIARAEDGGTLEVWRPQPTPARELPAFPQAEGFGAYTPGGRGGKVFAVTTLEDNEPDEPVLPGSLREAATAAGPRIVVFAVAGNILLKTKLEVTEPYLTVAGQTAPGGGICLTGGGLIIATHDVILRHLRLRPAGKGSPDALSLVHAQNVLVDHCSMSFSGDELCAATKQCSDVTVQWCLLSEPLNRRGHAQPVVLSGRRISFHHNVIADGDRCNPKVGEDGPIDIRNNLIVNWQSQAAGGDAARVNVVGNVLRPGADTRARGGPDAATAFWMHDSAPPGCLYAAENVMEGDAAGTGDNWRLVAPVSSKQLQAMTAKEFTARYRAERPFAAEEIATEPAAEASAKALQFAGATLPQRDAIDARVLAAIAAGKGRIIREADDVGGLAKLAAGKADDDRDGDGMPNDWENRFGLNSSDANDGPADRDGDGYTNVEEFLNGTDPRVGFPNVASPVIEPPDGSIFLGSTKVALSCPAAGAEIRYTLDGTEPTQSSALYAAPVALGRTATVRARAYVGMVASRTSSADLRKVAPQPPAKVTGLKPGLAYEWSGPVAGGPEGHDTVWKLARSGVVEQPGIDWLPADAKWPKINFTGWVTVPRDGLYTFTLSAPANCELWIDDTRAVLNDTGAYGNLQAVAALARGPHAVRVYYFTWYDVAPLKLAWQGPGLENQPIPAEAFSHKEKD